MLTLSDFSFEYAGRYLYKNASWHIKPNEKIGLVGLNGTGKSTLLKIIHGDYELREGIFSKSSGLKIGFLNQDLLSVEYPQPVVDVVLQGREDLYKIDKRIHQILEIIETDHSVKLIEELTQLQEEFGMNGGYDWQSNAEKILEGLGFRSEELNKPLNLFSGGWRMRAILAKLLLMQPDILLLDEPTNHLDLPSIQWLENYLSAYQGTYIIVSHDRFFLDKTVNKIAEVAHQQLFHYTGNFTDYLDQKEERDELMQRRFENQQDFIKQQMRFIERFRYKASKANAVQSRVKMLNKIDKIEILEEDRRAMNIKFNMRTTPGKLIFDIKNISKKYGSLEIFNKANAQVFRGDKIALIGANGKGKSTLLRMIFGTENYEGEIEYGWNAEAAFYAQHQLEALDLKNNLLDELGKVSAEYTERELRTTLGCFLFTGEDVFKKIKILSGGEKSRVALAKTLLTQANVMLLDEPTNHLDMFSTSVLADALIQYKGSLLIVSHDRVFLSQVATKIWWIEEGQLREFDGTYDEYNEWVEKMKPAQELKIKEKKSEKTTTNSVSIPAQNSSKTSKNAVQQLEKKIEETEARIKDLENQKRKIESNLLLPEIAVDFKKINELTDEFSGIEKLIGNEKRQLDAIMEEWLSLQD